MLILGLKLNDPMTDRLILNRVSFIQFKFSKTKIILIDTLISQSTCLKVLRLRPMDKPLCYPRPKIIVPSRQR